VEKEIEGKGIVQSYLSQYEEIDPTLANSFENFIKEISFTRFDCVIADYNLAGNRKGTEVFQYLRENGISTPFIILTGYLGEEEKIMILRDGGRHLRTQIGDDKLFISIAKIIIEAHTTEETRNQMKETLQCRIDQLRCKLESNV